MAAAEYYSEHPLGRAVVAAGDFRPVPGRGVTAHVGEDVVDVGSPALLNERDHTSLRIVSELEESGHTAVVVRVNGVTVVALRLTDRLRHGAAEALAQITAVTGIRPLLLIGDNHLLLTGHNHRAASRLAA